MHSALSMPEKRKLWQDLLSDKARVIIGARSACLAPKKHWPYHC